MLQNLIPPGAIPSSNQRDLSLIVTRSLGGGKKWKGGCDQPIDPGVQWDRLIRMETESHLKGRVTEFFGNGGQRLCLLNRPHGSLIKKGIA